MPVAGITLEALLPFPEGDGHSLRGHDEVTLVVVDLRLLSVMALLKKINGTIGGADVPPHTWILELAVDHVVKVGLGREDLTPEGVLYGLA